MTHALHREGSIKSLRGDYVLLAMVSRANRETAGPAMARFAQIALGADPTNYGSSTFALNRPLGLQPEDFIRRAPEADGVACVFTSKEELRQVLVELKEADLGLSITVSGLTDEVLALAREVGLKPHSVELSLGILGDTGQLAEAELLEVMTMCGHSRISAALIKRGAREVEEGLRSAEDVAHALGRPCSCGLFNLRRGELLLSRMVEGR